MRRGGQALSDFGARVLLALAILAVATRSGVAQNPTAPATAPTPVANGTLSGTVMGADGMPLPGATVSLVGETSSAITDSAGRFAIRDIAPGSHIALVRRIGYRSVEHRFAMRSGANVQFVVSLRAVAQQLNQVVVEARGVNRRRGTSSISGSVADSAGRAVAGADVRLLGSGLSTVTDSAGSFQFRTLAAGPYIVRSRKAGLAAGNAVMQIADEDDRDISIKMWGIPNKTKDRDVAIASGYKVADLGFDSFDRRARARSASIMLGPGDLFRENGAPLDFVLREHRESRSLSRRSSGPDPRAGGLEENDCILVDGKRVMYRPLSTFTSISVVLVEVFRTNSFVDDFILSEMQAIRECRGNMMRHPSYFVLWTRSLR